MIRNSFNGGVLSPSIRMREDLDVFRRGCSVLENFDVGQAGGIRRRRGFRRIADAQNEHSRLFAYKYRNDTRYLVEVGTEYIRVYYTDGGLAWETGSPYIAEVLPSVRTLQVNALLLVMSRYLPPMQLTCDGKGKWSWGVFEYSVPPWRYSEYRDYPICVSRRNDGYYHVDFDVEEDEEEATPEAREVLRASYYTDAQQIKMAQASIFAKVSAQYETAFISASTNIAKGTVFAVRQKPEYSVYSVVEDFTGDTMFVQGLIDPANYTGNFQLASDATTHDFSIAELSKSSSYTKGQRVRFEAGYWDIYTCINDFDGSTDYYKEGIEPSDYPGHFVRGVMLGAAPSKGAWHLYVSGTWAGSYEVRASYTGSSMYDDWEYRGESFSRIIAPSNNLLAGDENSEECYISLWLTRARAYGSNWTARCIPADSCGNVLSVSSYKHDLILQHQIVEDEDSGDIIDAYYILRDPIKTTWYGSITTTDWSWCAFSSKYGFPRLACIFNQRLVFAGTEAQPQTLWLSRTDDIDNFDILQQDDGAMALTMSSQTQDPIRWMMCVNNRIMLGTAEGESIIQSGNGGAVMTYANATIATHGFVGSADVDAIACNDKTVYFERGGARAMQFGYSYEQDAYLSTDLSIFAEHILRDGGGVAEGTFLRKPDAKAVLVLKNGNIACMTYNSQHQVNAWHLYTTQGRFFSVCMLPNGNNADSLYAVTGREEVREVDSGLADPEDTEWMYYIECQDESSQFEDTGERDYISEMQTNALTSTSIRGSKQSTGPVMMYLGDETSAAGVEVTSDAGKTWSRPDKSPRGTFPAGWNKLVGYGNNQYDQIVGVRVRGNQAFQLLAVQA